MRKSYNAPLARKTSFSPIIYDWYISPVLLVALTGKIESQENESRNVKKMSFLNDVCLFES